MTGAGRRKGVGDSGLIVAASTLSGTIPFLLGVGLGVCRLLPGPSTFVVPDFSSRRENRDGSFVHDESGTGVPASLETEPRRLPPWPRLLRFFLPPPPPPFRPFPN